MEASAIIWLGVAGWTLGLIGFCAAILIAMELVFSYIPAKIKERVRRDWD